MSKAGVEHAEKLLANPQVSMVIVRLTIPIGVDPTDRLDVQVEVPPACGTTSLAGGYLLKTRLREVLIAGRGRPAGHDMALAQGPIMIGTPAKPNDPKVGRVLGGGRVKKEYPFTLVIKENRESYSHVHDARDGCQQAIPRDRERTPERCRNRENLRAILVLNVPAVYHQNQEHYFRVVQLLPMIDTPELQLARIAAWSKELLDPTTAGVAAMKLEGLGLPASIR